MGREKENDEAANIRRVKFDCKHRSNIPCIQQQKTILPFHGLLIDLQDKLGTAPEHGAGDDVRIVATAKEDISRQSPRSRDREVERAVEEGDHGDSIRNHDIPAGLLGSVSFNGHYVAVDQVFALVGSEASRVH